MRANAEGETVGHGTETVGHVEGPSEVLQGIGESTLLLLWTLLSALLPWGGSDAMAETIVIRTGPSGGTAGGCGDLDDGFRHLSSTSCGVDLRASAFDATDFSDAAAGPAASIVDPAFDWIPSLSCDPEARWINDSARCPAPGGDPRSVLHACDFEVTTPGDPEGNIEICWAVDDLLGDPTAPSAGPNPIAWGAVKSMYR